MPKNGDHFIGDYKKPDFLVPYILLTFKIDHNKPTTVRATYLIKPKNNQSDLVLNGDRSVGLVSVKIISNNIGSSANIPHELVETDDGVDLIIRRDLIKQHMDQNNNLLLDIVQTIDQDKNTELQGMYRSNGIYCTHCEPTGFRKIVYSFDRPDVLSRYVVSIEADRTNYPVLLSNGNLIKTSNLADNYHSAVWYDPYPKPCYLFALVAGKLGYIEDVYYIKNQKTEDNLVVLRIYANPNKLDQLELAMSALKLAMRWDEDTYDLCYDLKHLSIICMDDQNSGAMENKGINIFNSSNVLATYETATDQDQERIISVIGHEYFHNWSGNRVTIEKWFDLTLKEGLTNFREYQFMRDTSHSRVGQLIDWVVLMRNQQYVEDLGSNAHPIRPQHYKVFDNFYTSTVYDKGGDVIRMYQTYLGDDVFKKGLQHYFKTYDGMAVSCEDFWKAMRSVDKNTSDIPMKRLFEWYGQAGTPQLDVRSTYDWDKKEYTVHCKQTNKKCIEMTGKYNPMLIPIRMGLIDRTGKPIIPSNQTIVDKVGSFVLNFYELESSFVLKSVNEHPVPSLMRDFSAPVNLIDNLNIEDRMFLMENDLNLYNRWEQSQMIHKHIISGLYTKKIKYTDDMMIRYISTMVRITTDPKITPILKFNMVSLPHHNELLLMIADCDPVYLYENVIRKIYRLIGQNIREYLEQETERLIEYLLSNAYRTTILAVPKETFELITSKRNLLKLYMMISLSDRSDRYVQIVVNMMIRSKNLTDQTDCLSALCRSDDPADNPTGSTFAVLKKMISQMIQRYKNDKLMIARCIRYVALIRSPRTVEWLGELFGGTDPNSKYIDKNNPNHMYSLVLGFTANPYMHNLTKKNNNVYAYGYQYMADCLIELDRTNPHVSKKIARAFEYNKNLTVEHKLQMEKCVKKILGTTNISAFVKEKIKPTD
jgi:aminopeptidase N